MYTDSDDAKAVEPHLNNNLSFFPGMSTVMTVILLEFTLRKQVTTHSRNQRL